MEQGQPISILAVYDEPGEARQLLGADEAYLDKPFTRKGLRRKAATAALDLIEGLFPAHADTLP